MIDLVPPWLEIAGGGLGVAWALSAIARANREGWRGAQDRTSAWGLLILGVLLALIGSIRFVKL